MKKDKYLSDRGGTAKMLDISCMNCEKKLFTYQKDGPGGLRRCYLNRIQKGTKISRINDNESISNLVCVCGELIGVPMKHKDGRIAFRLIRGKFKQSRNKSKTNKK